MITERTIGCAQLAQPLCGHGRFGPDSWSGSEPAQRAGIRNHKVVIDPLLMIIERASQCRLLLHSQDQLRLRAVLQTWSTCAIWWCRGGSRAEQVRSDAAYRAGGAAGYFCYFVIFWAIAALQLTFNYGLNQNTLVRGRFGAIMAVVRLLMLLSADRSL